ncbi:MAG: DUF4388 domain-containing protein [Calditrichaeota bacterium]|nr:DUF4388 domain-containing protein [Calditrichota bacterium]
MPETIFIGARQDTEATKISEKLTRTGLITHLFDNVRRLQEWMADELPDVLVLDRDFFHQLEGDAEFVQNIPTVVYGSGIDLGERVRLFDSGVREVVDATEELPERVAEITQMVLNRARHLRPLRQKRLTYGTLKVFPLGDLLQNAILESKNLIMKIRMDGWNAKLQVFQGRLVRAEAPHLSGIDALLKAMFLPEGTFTIRAFERHEEVTTEFPSTFALIAEARFEHQKVQAFVRAYEMENPSLRVVEPFPQKVPDELKQLLEAIKRYQHFREILIKHPAPVWRTFKQLEWLIREGLVQVAREEKRVDRLQDQDIQFLRQHLFPENVQEGKIIVLGLPTSGKSDLIRTFAGLQKSQVKTVQSLDFTRIRLANDLRLSLFGVSIEEYFQPILEKISEGVLAMIFLVDYQRPERFEYTKYLFHQFIQNYDVPFVVGVTNWEDGAEDAVRRVREALEVPDALEILPVQVTNFKDLRNLIYNLRNYTRLETEEKNA